jgi:hypothetical protein
VQNLCRNHTPTLTITITITITIIITIAHVGMVELMLSVVEEEALNLMSVSVMLIHCYFTLVPLLLLEHLSPKRFEVPEKALSP